MPAHLVNNRQSSEDAMLTNLDIIYVAFDA